MQYFDVHAHIFPHDIAGKAVSYLENYYGFVWQGTAEVEDLAASCRASDIDKCVIFSSATKPEQVRKINDFIAATCAAYPGLFIGMGTMHPDYPDMANEFDRIRSLGLKGVKFHPDFQNFAIDDPAAMEMYRLAGNDLVMLFHVGDENRDISAPFRLANAAEEFPQAAIIAAHMGGYSRWDEAEKYLVGRNIYLDVSSSVSTGKLSVDDFRRLIRAHGVDKILFASDYPAVKHEKAISDALLADLTDEEMEKIFFRNAEKLFGVKCR